MAQIINIQSREILNSNGMPTLEVEVFADNGAIGRASVPSGTSLGKYEAFELRDGDKERYAGKGVQNAIRHITDTLNEELNGANILDQRYIDSIMLELDGTENKLQLGANTTLAVSLAVAKTAAQTTGQPLYRYIGGINANLLPIPMMNLITGGTHSSNNLDIQEFMIMPIGAENFSEALRMEIEIFYQLQEVLQQHQYSTNRGIDGGFSPNLSSNEEALNLILEAVEKTNYRAGEEVFIAIDAAASHFFDSQKNKYCLSLENKEFSSDEMIDFWEKLTQKYPILSLEDALSEDDWQGWISITQKLGNKIQIVGDDLFATNILRLQKGINEKAANSVIIKPNQVGTLTETILAIQTAQTNSFGTIISFRSGETEDTTVSELAVALNTGLIKTGPPFGLNITKYNQLLRIEENLGDSARYPTKDFRIFK